MRFYSNSTNMVFGIIMMIVVIVLGVIVAFTDWYDDRLFGWRRTLFVVMMFAYAIYRGFRVYQEFRNGK
jgi:uncharacterized membrane protein